MASKNARALTPSRAAIARLRASDVSGPVAITPGDGSSVTSPRARRLRGDGSGLRERHFVRALQALPVRPHRLGLPLLHPHEPAVRAGHGDRAIPDGIVTLGIAQAPEEAASLARAPLGQIALAALG